MPAPSTNRQIRVFISSTFADMKADRDYLVKFIFPQLRKLCEDRAATLTEVDFRWGVNDEQKAEGKVLPIVMAEIERCQPYFIGLLGERYGQVYRDNIPADLAEQFPWLKDHRDTSLTELEILHGVLHNKELSDHALFYFRDPAYVQGKNERERADFISSDETSRRKLEHLKQRIRDAHARNRLKFAPCENYSNPEVLGEQVLADFTAIIEKLFPKQDVPDPLDQEATRHDAYARSRRLAFVGRESLLRRLGEQVSNAGKPLVLTGESGCGKSALLAEWVNRHREKNPDDLIIQHYIGSTPDSADWQGLVRRILGELKREFAIADDIPNQPDALRNTLQDWTTKSADPRRCVILVLDALNQLADDGAARQLGWLPVIFPANLRVLVSTLRDESLDVLQKRAWPELNVPLFSQEDIAPVTRAYFEIFSKTPSKEIVAKLEATPAACNALYLRSVLDELRQFGEHEQLQAKADDYLAAPDLPELFDRILTRWHDDFGNDPEHPDLVRRALCLIACARFGLLESELLDLLGKNGERLPGRYWTPFYLAAENALALRAGLLNFSHEYLSAAVQKRWLQNEETVRAFRLQLADYYEGQEPTFRQVEELPWQLQRLGQTKLLLLWITSVCTFVLLNKRRASDLYTYWEFLKEAGYSAGNEYLQLLATHKGDATEIRALSWIVGRFLLNIGEYMAAESALERVANTGGIEHGGGLASNLGPLNDLARLFASQGRHAKAVECYRRILAFHEEHNESNHFAISSALGNLATSLIDSGSYEDSKKLFQQAIDRLSSARETDTKAMRLKVDVTNNYSVLLERMGCLHEAESLLKANTSIARRLFGERDSDTIHSMHLLGTFLAKIAPGSEAEALLTHVYEIRSAVNGGDHPETLATAVNLGALLQRTGDYRRAEPILVKIVKVWERMHGYVHQDTLLRMKQLADCWMQMGEYTKAESMFEERLRRRQLAKGQECSDAISDAYDLSLATWKLGRFGKAEELFRWCVGARERTLGFNHQDTIQAVYFLAGFLVQQGRFVDAIPLFERVYAERVSAQGANHPDAEALRQFLVIIRLVPQMPKELQRSVMAQLQASTSLSSPTPLDSAKH